MRIAIPVDKQNLEASVNQTFGRTPYFLIYDTETKENVFIDNSAAASQGGAGIKAAQSIVDNKAEAVLTPLCGENAAEVLNAAGIKIYKTVRDASVMDTINAFMEGKLAILEDIHPGFHGQGGK
ncbi:Dinitrogenase iron-molybdenum cofactor [Sporotomaculum syntrophicum]|uniref:Dinitrogenase iron-molybdenum cofactor n=1 Tax=Sporotomaculum syntrophicum TaxID=182264 RepID=A0A9D3AXT0_9FIRM|nr:NifB/NifX family molybdenum-iron cluster-binding protein [Sporotomaculum syntrophicum]KAF1083983.1 Dinitrogenase iron-molybdenum cofactor [Sporotomaculum syntrophicum]